jgi:hypothetical protein
MRRIGGGYDYPHSCYGHYDNYPDHGYYGYDPSSSYYGNYAGYDPSSSYYGNYSAMATARSARPGRLGTIAPTPKAIIRM